MFTAVLSSARKRDLKSECFMIARFMALQWTSPRARETRDDPIGERKETLMSRKQGRRERPQESRAWQVFGKFMLKWDSEEEPISVQECFYELFDYFREHQDEMKMISDGSRYWFRFIGDGQYCISISQDDDGTSSFGVAGGPTVGMYDDDMSSVIFVQPKNGETDATGKEACYE